MSEQAPDPRPPEGVRLKCQDGRVIECDVVRDPGFDRPPGHPSGHVTYWRAVPREEVQLGTFELEVDVTPAHTAIWVDVPLVGPGLSALGTP
jgi:hypothetical protein